MMLWFECLECRVIHEECQTNGGGVANILVVEDEDLVMEMTTELLEFLGHRVLKAGDGGNALRLFAEHQKNIDLVLLDLSLPDMNGLDLLSKMEAFKAQLKAIVCSGDISPAAVSGHLPPNVSFLPKPFSLQTLREAVEKNLFRDG
jgi:CheY-like chemotaxis protein